MTDNNELRQLFEQDQAIRRAWTGAGPASFQFFLRLLWNDWRRRRRLRRLIQSGALQAGEDYYRAAMLLQHSPRVGDYWQAHQLSERVELGYRPARWLAAASLDRWLLARGLPQKYGTQYVPAGRPRWMWWAWWSVRRVRLWDVDPTTTDDERHAFGVPSLAEALAQAETLLDPRSSNRLGPSLATIEMGDVVVDVQDVRAILAAAPTDFGVPPRATPVQPGDAPVHVWLPQGLAVCRVGTALGGVREDGEVVIVWRQQHLRSNEPFVSGWRWDQPPHVENVVLNAGPAVLIGDEPDGSATVITAARPGAYWSVWGRVSRDELLRVAGSLPKDAEMRIA